ncbi:hypothetical protein HDU97_005655 [Phlyctochytrium planicorne]|nr:hypothetical protein HDU97_005655 [Phlyctochytrium planicorne]
MRPHARLDAVKLPDGACFLIISYFLTSWAMRMDEWSIALMLSYIYPSNLFYISAYSLAQTVAAAVLGPLVGSWIERSSTRYQGVVGVVAAQKIGIAGASLGLWCMDRWLMSNAAQGWRWAVFGAAIVFGCLMKLGNLGCVIGVERDWVVIMAGGNTEVLMRMNVHLRRIDLFCKLSATIFVSFLASWLTVPVTVLGVAAWCILTLPIEIVMLGVVYEKIPALAIPRCRDESEEVSVEDEDGQGLLETERGGGRYGTVEQDDDATQQQPPCKERLPRKEWSGGITKRSLYAWKLFAKQPIRLASVAVSLLYFTTVAFGGVMVTFLLSLGYSAELLAGMKGLAVLCGLIATVTLPKLTAAVGLTSAGLWGVWSEFFTLLPMIVAIAAVGRGDEDGKVSVGWSIALFGGAILSRWGLWTFDLVETQLVQESVSNSDMGVINGVQFSLQNIFELMSYIVTMVRCLIVFVATLLRFAKIWYDPADFYLSAIMTLVAVFGAGVIYTVYLTRGPGNITSVVPFSNPYQRNSINFSGKLIKVVLVILTLKTMPPDKRRAVKLPNGSWFLVVSYFLTSWATRMDEWSIGMWPPSSVLFGLGSSSSATALILSYIFPSNLFYISVYSLIQTSSAVLLGSMVGAWVERTRTRLGAFVGTVIAQKLGIVGASLTLWVVQKWFLDESQAVWKWILFAVAVACGCVMRSGNVGMAIGVERDWVVVMAKGDGDVLMRLNLHLRRVDLFCKLVATLFVSFVATWLTIPGTTLGVAGWCLVSLPVELLLVSVVYRKIPALAVPRGSPSESVGANVVPDEGWETAGRTGAEEGEASGDSPRGYATMGTQAQGPPDVDNNEMAAKKHENALVRAMAAWKLFGKHPIHLASIAISLLYFTTITFGGVMVTYLLSLGYSAELLAGMKGLAVISGLMATVTLPKLSGAIGLVRSGLWGIWSEFLSLVPMVLAVVMVGRGSGGGISGGWTIALFGGAVVSRWGLWTFDLVETQLLQESVSNNDAGVINGVQFSLQNVFELSSYVVTMVWYDPSDFYISVILSAGAVFLACLFYTVYAKSIRGHLFHFDKLAKWNIISHTYFRGRQSGGRGAGIGVGVGAVSSNPVAGQHGVEGVEGVTADGSSSGLLS